MQCEQVSELIDAYALGALDEPERSAVERHLGGCVACRALLERAENLAARLALAIPLRGAPPALRSRVLGAIWAERSGAFAPVPAGAREGDSLGSGPLSLPAQPPKRFDWRARHWWPAGAAAAAVVLLLGAGGWIAALQMQVNTLQSKSHILEQGMSDVQGQRSALQLLASIGSSSLPMWPAASTPAQGTVIWNAMREECSVLASDLPPAPSGESYHVWLLGEDQQQVAWDEGPLSPATAGTAQKTIDLHHLPMEQVYQVVIMLQPRQSNAAERQPVLRATVEQH